MVHLIVGLGNPGAKYARTRHNIGSIVVDHFLQNAHDINQMPQFQYDKKLDAEIAKGVYLSTDLILMKPSTYMNESGRAIQAARRFFKVPGENILVIHDDADIEFGNFSFVHGGTGAGHRGVGSIVRAIGDGFYRLKVGVSNPHRIPGQAIEFVLKPFTSDEWTLVPNLCGSAGQEIERFLQGNRDNHRLRWRT